MECMQNINIRKTPKFSYKFQKKCINLHEFMQLTSFQVWRKPSANDQWGGNEGVINSRLLLNTLLELKKLFSRPKTCVSRQRAHFLTAISQNVHFFF